MVSSTASSTVWNFYNLIIYHKFLFGGKTAWRASLHSMWVTLHSLSMQSCPTGAPPHDFLCRVAPVRQLGMEGISAFYTGQVVEKIRLSVRKSTCTWANRQAQAVN